MGILELLLLSVGLAMDAFAVAICKGLALDKVSLKKAAIVGIWFGAFQALMPALGWLLGSAFEQYIVAFDHWIAFVLLGMIGFNMIREALSKDEEPTDCSLCVKAMLPLAIATSIDALAVGVSFAFLQVLIVPAVCFIGITTFVFSAVGVKLGSVFGEKYSSRAELAGGIVLIAMGTKILLEHLGIIG